MGSPKAARAVGMAKTYDVRLVLPGHAEQGFHAEIHSLMMSVGHKKAMAGQIKRHRGQQLRIIITIAAHNAAGAGYQPAQITVPPLHITTVDHLIHRKFPFHHPLHPPITAVGITDHQNFHFSILSFIMVFIFSRAFPLWLILFFCSSESSAVVQPYSGAIKIGS